MSEVRLTKQQATILRHLELCDSITSAEAFHKYGVSRLSAVIFQIKKAGFPVASLTETKQNRDGETVHFTRYFLIK